MKTRMVITAAIISFSLSTIVIAAEHGSHTMEHKSSAAHEEVVDGVKATFNVQTMADAMQEMGMAMPKGVNETHHISVTLKDVKSGKTLSEGTATIKVQNPDKSSQTKDLSGMHGHFGADFEFQKSGKYGVMCKFVVKDGKTRQAKFWYSVK